MGFSLLALPLGLLIGLALGALGGGGSILTVPALVYAIGESPAQATTASLIIVGLTALTGAASHGRAGRVRWLPGSVFGMVGVGGSVVGSHLNSQVNPNLLLLAFSGLMVLAAAAMLQGQRSAAPAPADVNEGMPGAAPVAGRRALSVAVAGTVVGFLTGFFGVGGGFVVVPVLLVALGFGMRDAVGTSLLIIAINTIAALAARGGATAVDWWVVAPFALAAMLGSILGNRITGRVPPSTLTRVFAALLVVLAAYVATRSAVALA